jgi:hypothetical protein
MKQLGRFPRALAKLRFRVLGLATIRDISGDKFKSLISGLQRQGWRPGSRYSGFDAGIDYDRFRLRRGLSTLTCEWDNWTEWSLEGRRPIIEAVAQEHRLKVTYAWRWSEYDGMGDA